MSISCSLIIPIFNEEKILIDLFNQLTKIHCFQEIIFVDGGSQDNSAKMVRESPFKLVQSPLGRAIQLNAGATASKGDYLLFLHADIGLPAGFESQINDWVSQSISLANFKLKFDWRHWFLNANARFSHLTYTPFQFGDQGLWVKRTLFYEIGAYCEEMILLEDQDMVKRLKKKAKLIKSSLFITVSARKYRSQGAFRLQFIYYLIYAMYRLGFSQKNLVSTWNKCLRSD